MDSAALASGAVPGAFAPYTIDGRVLIDGFASRNLPVSVVRDMGVDIVIAVDVREDLLPAAKLTTPIGMAEQLISILSQRDTLEQIKTLGPQDVLVRLKLPGFGAASFPEALSIAQRGYEEAGEARVALAALALPPATPRTELAPPDSAAGSAEQAERKTTIPASRRGRGSLHKNAFTAPENNRPGPGGATGKRVA